MPFLRFSRDRRGYENLYLVQPAGRRARSLPRILYWFRTPPNVKVGREPFDESVRRALEAQYRDVAFNWPKLLATPFPPPDTERWRERRRAERSARRVADTEVEEANPTDSEVPANVIGPVSGVSLASPVSSVSPVNIEASGGVALNGEARAAEASEPPHVGAAIDPGLRRRRRRRRRRGGRGDRAAVGGSPAAETNAVDPGRSGEGE